MNVYVVDPIDRRLEELLHVSGMHTTRASADDLSALAAQPVVHGQVVVVDMRQRGTLPPGVAQMRQQHPTVGVVIFASSLDPILMLEAMHAGVTEFVTEPTTQEELNAAIDRVAAKRPASEVGDVYAFVGGKGGIGTTTLAVNTAAAVAQRHPGSALLIDLHAAYGDAALFLGSEPRFSVADALENVSRLDDAFLRSLVGHTKFGLDILASSERAVPEPVDVRAVRRLIECASHHYRSVILDVPRADQAIMDALEMAVMIVVVTNQELATLRSASRMAVALRQRYSKDRVAIVVTRFDPTAEIGRKEIERVMGGSVVHVFPSNYRVALGALNVGRPLVLDNHNKLAASFESFVRDLLPDPPHADAVLPGRPGGLFGRLGLRTS
jgi:pilus assembly protein CpaE